VLCGFRLLELVLSWGMDSQLDIQSALAALVWQSELGATEAICDEPVDRFVAAEPHPVKPQKNDVAAIKHSAEKASGFDPVEIAQTTAVASQSLEALAGALAAFDYCELKKGARNTVFADGNPEARVMIIGEAPGREEDMQGKPFVGRAGQLLDRMFAAIGMSRQAAGADAAIYIANILPWRPPQNRDPLPEEIAMMMPFVRRHVELVSPDVLVLMGNTSCQGVLGKRGITRLRGNWAHAYGLPVLPMFHPAYLLRNPLAKREAWQDLLMLQTKLRESNVAH